MGTGRPQATHARMPTDESETMEISKMKLTFSSIQALCVGYVLLFCATVASSPKSGDLTSEYL
jgi:hypothetical protein